MGGGSDFPEAQLFFISRYAPSESSKSRRWLRKGDGYSFRERNKGERIFSDWEAMAGRLPDEKWLVRYEGGENPPYYQTGFAALSIKMRSIDGRIHGKKSLESFVIIAHTFYSCKRFMRRSQCFKVSHVGDRRTTLSRTSRVQGRGTKSRKGLKNPREAKGTGEIEGRIYR